ncbi:MAG: NADH:ubiquinone oxidoreductase [Pseudomonadota bacterium]
MQDDKGGMNCTLSSFVMAAVIAALAIIVTRFFGELSWEGSIFVGVLVFGLFAFLFNYIFCRELPALGDVEVPGSANQSDESPKPAAVPSAAPAAVAKEATKPAPKPKAKTKSKPKADPAPAATGDASRPAALEAAREGAADNLKEIKGIGPKLEKLCNTLGFYHFDQIAGWTADEVAWVDQNLEGFKGRVTRDNWVEQAKILAAGGETEFSKRVDDGDVY